jgi:hypothetical protein
MAASDDSASPPWAQVMSVIAWSTHPSNDLGIFGPDLLRYTYIQILPILDFIGGPPIAMPNPAIFECVCSLHIACNDLCKDYFLEPML